MCVCVCVFINKINRWQPRVSMTEAASLASLYIAKAITERSREGLKARRQGDRERERQGQAMSGQRFHNMQIAAMAMMMMMMMMMMIMMMWMRMRMTMAVGYFFPRFLIGRPTDPVDAPPGYPEKE